MRNGFTGSATCPRCRRNVLLTQDGKFWRHPATVDGPLCSGSKRNAEALTYAARFRELYALLTEPVAS